MPTQRKIESVEEMRKWMEECTIAISTDYTGLGVGAMTALRRALRENGVQYRIVKNTLALLAADAAGRTAMRDLIEGPTGIAYGYGDPSEPAKAIAEFVRSSRSPLKVRGGLMGDRSLSANEVSSLATLPSKDELVARLLGQMNAPITGLVYVLNGPVAGLARVLQRQVEKLEQETPAT